LPLWIYARQALHPLWCGAASIKKDFPHNYLLHIGELGSLPTSNRRINQAPTKEKSHSPLLYGL
jgi:hypothetical protein